ncbi:hypothetical protein L486_04961 [Kwoniella mangroviensis CBS 10435]|uniref:sterol 3beta-glucosyltransferase n=1 Tax=Kwoniella mangroviensis CBS 10435 TaxID=1331196 RepID=A0A1B9IPK6_9TREE|nr:uncharacterized protein I203_00300 [Kwoniella mangroviensis CBS 8507]OCF57503.1 hypothetical protein L486_04961 [Kwoniella mangroviensis CBS 10435]OCF70168.1 hypothetical protein I203_00300 [Kwoniella mangroviensis CBS 8507]
MPAVTKKLANIFSSPSASPRLNPATPTTPVPPLTTSDTSAATTQVTRGGMPSSCQLFDLFKFMAGGNSDLGLAGGEADSDEDEASSTSDMSNTSAAAQLPTETTQDEDGLQKWIDETLKETERERSTLSARFTAMSLSNLASMSLPKCHKHRPVLPKVDAIEPSPELGEEPPSVDNPSIASESAAVGVSDISDEEKLLAIKEEFGDIAGLMEGGEAERMLADTKGSLFKGVMMIGNFHLTTHRLLFHAIIPPDSLDPTPTPSGPDVICAGPVTIHRPGLQQAKRVWMELTPEMVTTYPSANESDRVRPIRSVLLSSVRERDPMDLQHPCDFYVTLETPVGLRRTHFTVDTEQSANQWRRSFDRALFRSAKARWRSANGQEEASDEWSYMRCCVPLDRTTIKGISPYHSFATLVGLEANLRNTRQVDSCSLSGKVVQGDFTTEEESAVQKVRTPPAEMLKRSFSSPRGSEHRSASPARKHFFGPIAQTMPEDSTLTVSYGNRLEFNIGVFNEQAWFTKALQTAVLAAAQRRYKPDVQLPPVIFQISGHDVVATDEDLEQTLDSFRTSSQSGESIHDEEDSRGDALLQETRKAERASMAAKVFGLKEDEGVWIKRCYVATNFVPARGHIILNPHFICFWRRNTIGSDLKYRFRIADIKGATPAPSLRVGFVGMALHIHGHRDLRFEFWNKDSRDEVITHLNALLVNVPRSTTSLINDQKPPAPQFDSMPIPRAESPLSLGAEDAHPADILAPSRESIYHSRALPDEAITYMPFLANKPVVEQIRLTPRTFVCLTIGSRGDVQPYIALGLRLLKDGHKVVIVTHPEFKKWVEGYGIEHRQAGGDPTALMKLSQEHKMFSPGFFKESLGGFREWLDNLLIESWQACHDADVLIESPSTMAGIHIAEALKIPYFRAFTMPWTRTSAYPHAFMVPAFEMGPSFNYSTYVLFDNIMWKATAGQINRWRKKYLNLKSTDMAALSVTKVPFLYNFSSAVVPKPLDWHDDIVITGYWNLEDSDTDWSPSPDLDAFLNKAKEDGKALVYIGFGSIVVPRPNEMTKSIIKAVEKADVRAIIAKGWSSRGGDPAKEGEDIAFPASCFGVDKIPHSWLFPKVQAALHHGGAGTVGASLRAGIPTLIKPWFGDQFFWSVRVTKLEVGLKVPSLRSDVIANALIKATTDVVMIEKAARIGEKIRSESGVDQALQAIHHNLIRAGMDRRNLKWSS